jgi:hypothetical protein
MPISLSNTYTIKEISVMKKLLIIILTLHASLLTLHGVLAQDFEVRTLQNDMDYLVLQIRETSGTGMPTTSSDITDIQFEIRWPKSYGSDLDVDLICDTWSLVEGLGVRQSEGTYYWRVFAALNVPFSPASNWLQDQWETVGIFKVVTSSSGTGTFQVPPDAWVIQGLNFGLDGVDFTPDVLENVTDLPYPTEVYYYVWKGGSTATGYDENSWTLGTNWEDPCGNIFDAGSIPVTGFSCYIPSGLTYYPSNFNVHNAGECDILRIEGGGSLTVPNAVTMSCNQLLLENASDLEIENGGTMEVEE